jgi:isohexenylglutaconyl-CoA hydratase
MKLTETLDIQIKGTVARVTLNRPDAHNAMSDQMVIELLSFFESIRENRYIRVVVLAAAGETFCSGGDIKDMQTAVSEEDRMVAMSRFDQMLRAVNEAPQVTIARIQGAAMGGGFGLVCVSDVAIASETAKFGLPEVRLGVAPALISPYVIARLGMSRARQLMLTGVRFDAVKALDYGLVHEVQPPDELDARVETVVQEVLLCSPEALAATKELIFYVSERSLDASLQYRAELISRLRGSEEGQEGMMAFIQKRKPRWAE